MSFDFPGSASLTASNEAGWDPFSAAADALNGGPQKRKRARQATRDAAEYKAKTQAALAELAKLPKVAPVAPPSLVPPSAVVKSSSLGARVLAWCRAPNRYVPFASNATVLATVAGVSLLVWGVRR